MIDYNQFDERYPHESFRFKKKKRKYKIELIEHDMFDKNKINTNTQWLPNIQSVESWIKYYNRYKDCYISIIVKDQYNNVIDL